MKIYTLEAYAPAHPQTGRFVRVHCGDYESNRDSFSPSMIDAREEIHNNKKDAQVSAKTWVKTLNLTSKKKYKFQS